MMGFEVEKAEISHKNISEERCDTSRSNIDDDMRSEINDLIDEKVQ